jgi:hypothetical protein
MKIKKCHKPGPIMCISQAQEKSPRKKLSRPRGAGGATAEAPTADKRKGKRKEQQRRAEKGSKISLATRPHPGTATSPPSSHLPLRRRWHLRAPRPRRPPRFRRWLQTPERRLRAPLPQRRHKTLLLPRPRRPGPRIWRRRCAARSGSGRRW